MRNINNINEDIEKKSAIALMAIARECQRKGEGDPRTLAEIVSFVFSLVGREKAEEIWERIWERF